MNYEIKWITEHLGVGRAPMSYEDLDSIRDQGINAIVNLCHEYSDLHELEEQAGFEVYYLPTYDEYAPDTSEMEKGLEWLDEALYLKKKVLVHCRFGQGRTGTFTSAYLLRRGLGLKQTQKELKRTRAVPSTRRQWKALKKFSKIHGQLSLSAPHVDHNRPDYLSLFYEEYRAIVALIDEKMLNSGVQSLCGYKDDCCCHTSFDLPLIEALHLNDCLNRMITADAREAAIKRALSRSQQLQKSLRCLNTQQPAGYQELYVKDSFLCPLSVDGSCILFENRPIRCRSNGGLGLDAHFLETVMRDVDQLSNETFLSLAGQYPQGSGICTSLVDTISGKFFQTYFHLLAASRK